MFILSVITMLVVVVAGDPCPCNDLPPMASSGETQYTCEQQVVFGQCTQGWMQGYCECACGVCAYEPEAMSEMVAEPKTELTPEMSTQPMVEPAPKAKKGKKGKKGKKNRKADA
eukprot:TRINITY_DN1142_c0_g1_i1.p4 TRINITY_DN1142_c0_g1~~TRINITY_DN1142_c0_g1_i1.p4  ORF type:complete len:114 (-),score=24.62 TRINITY_DN1142_c0_g1_i1:339-680(-)